jgi:tRNA dimethylallyltransferase
VPRILGAKENTLPSAISVAAVLGPTASGKSALAEYLAGRENGELINADAAAVYQELSVGVTKPSLETQRAFVYHLLNVTKLERGFDLVEYLKAANEAIEEIASRGKLPIVVGGSGLYSRALLDGYRPPNVDVPQDLRETVRAMPLHQAVAELFKLDPQSHRRIDLRNPRRVARALELVLASGGPIAEPTLEPRSDVRLMRIYLHPAKPVLDARIKKRTEEMWEPWVEEVVQLEKKGLTRWLDVRKPIGYSSVLAYTKGEMSRDEAISDIVRQTVRLAKKQRTWLKKETEHPFCHHFLLDHEHQWEQVPDQALQRLREFLS